MKFIALASVLTAVHATSSFDYVVIGGGTAGLTVASRLADDPSISVAVLEAGPNAEGLPEVFVPGLLGTGEAYSTLSWAYKTVPQANLNNRILTIQAGKALGGSTVINSMIFPRAGSEQYDAWAILNSDPTWSWDNLLPYFKKSELFTPPNDFQAASGARYLPDVHGFTGRVKVGFPNFFYRQSTLWRNTSIGLGFSASPDLADGHPHAVGITPNSIDASNNTRCSAACAYYTPFADRPNFTVLTNATVTRIIWADSGVGSKLTASAVEFLLDKTTTTFEVRREVIVSAGTIGSPKILELSGVGNSTILKVAGVTPILDHPTVGENMADHVSSWANAFTNISLTKDALLMNPTFLAEQRALWFQNRTGLLSAIPRSLGLAAPSDIFSREQLDTMIADAEAHVPYFANKFSNGNPALAKGIEAQYKLTLARYALNKELPLEMNLEPGYSGPTPFINRPPRNFTTINCALYAPLSRGRSHITSSDPRGSPAIDPAYWSHPMDRAVQVAGIKLARRMLISPPLGEIYDGEFEPGADKDTDSKIEEWLMGVVGSDSHEIGTMSMLPQELGGVVDSSLRVYGTSNVRVADASIIPSPISAHLSSTVYMIGEKAADMIKSSRQA